MEAATQTGGFVEQVFDQAYELREEKTALHKRIAANRDIIRALYNAGQLTTVGETPKLDDDGNPVLVKSGEHKGEPVMEATGGQAAEALELYPTLLGRSKDESDDASTNGAAA